MIFRHAISPLKKCGPSLLFITKADQWRQNMVIGGLQKVSLIDFPGKVSCVVFIGGCNFKCPFCHNPELLKMGTLSPPLFGIRRFYDFLKKRKGFLDGVVISGGEPTLNEEILIFCKRIKRMGFAIKLDTNGSKPWMIKKLLDEKLIDYIAMDIKTDPFEYSPLFTENINPFHFLTSIRIILNSAPDYEFRTTCVKPLINPHSIAKIAKIIKGAKLYILQRFNDSKVLSPEIFIHSNLKFSEDELIDLKSVVGPWVKRCLIR